MIFSFEHLGVPVPKGRPRATSRPTSRGAFVRFYTPKKTRDAERRLRSLAEMHGPAAPLEGPIRLEVVFTFGMPKSYPGWARKVINTFRHQTKPDLDNCLKLVKDALNGVFWEDDKQVWSCVTIKQYGLTPSTWIRVEQTPQEAR